MTENAETKITYATLGGEGMEQVHNALEAQIEPVVESFGAEYGMIIGGNEVLADNKFEDYSPVDDRILLGTFQSGTEEHVSQAIEAARNAMPQWSGLHWQERVT